MIDKVELAAGIFLTALVVVVVIPALIIAITQGCFGKRRPGKEEKSGRDH